MPEPPASPTGRRVAVVAVVAALLAACGSGAPSLPDVLATSRADSPVDVAYRYVENIIGTEVEVTGRGRSNLDDQSSYCYQAARSLAFPETARGELQRDGQSLTATGELGRLVEAGGVARLRGGVNRLQLGSPEFVWWLLDEHGAAFEHTGTVEGAEGELLHYAGRVPPTVPDDLLQSGRTGGEVTLVNSRLDVWADLQGRLSRLTLRVLTEPVEPLPSPPPGGQLPDPRQATELNVWFEGYAGVEGAGSDAAEVDVTC